MESSLTPLFWPLTNLYFHYITVTAFRMLLLWLLLLVVTVKGDPFWTTVTLQDVTFQEGCIVDKNCDNMVFSIILEADEKDGRKQASWNLDSLIKNVSNLLLLR